MEESVDMLQTSPEAAPTDKYLTFLVMNHQLGEEIGVQFSLDEPCIAVDIADQRTQYALRSFERALEKQRSRVPEELMLRMFKSYPRSQALRCSAALLRMAHHHQQVSRSVSTH
jgi:hypothetical protein